MSHKTVTGFANVEEDFADQAVWDMGALDKDTHVMPWRVEDELKALGANYIQAGLWNGYAIRDGNLVPGRRTSVAARRPISSSRRSDAEPSRNAASAPYDAHDPRRLSSNPSPGP